MNPIFTEEHQPPPFPQGEPGFVRELKKHQVFRPHRDDSAAAPQNSVSILDGIKVESTFPDPEHALDTAFFDLDRFLGEAGLPKDKGLPVRFRKSDAFKEEDFRIETAADARSLESTVRARIAAPWTEFHFRGAAVPKLHFKVEPAEDQEHLAQVINTLSQAGFKADPAELSERFGLKLRYEAPAAPSAGFPMSADSGLSPRPIGLRDQPIGPIGPISPMVRGIRQPITLKNAEAEAVNDALDVDDTNDKALSDRSDRSDKSDKNETEFAQKVYGKCAEKLAALSSETDPAAFKKKLDRLIEDPEIDLDVFAAAVQRELMAGYLDGLKHSRVKRIYDE